MKYKIKKHLLKGDTIIMDNPLDEESPIGFTQYKNFEALSVLTFPDDEQAIGKFDFNKALDVLNEHWDDGWDFATGQMTFMQGDDEVKFGH